MKTALITGGAGFIGSHLIEELLKSTDYKIIILDNFSTGKTKNIPKSDRIKLFKGNISDAKIITEIKSNFKINIIFHLAAVASVQDSFNDPINTHNSNLTGTILLLNSFGKDIDSFIYASSAATYGDTKTIPTPETATQIPLSPYGIDKLAGEMYIRLYARLYNFNATACRFFNVFGERQDPSSPYSGVISIFFDKIMKEGNQTLTIYGDGKQTRDFIYVKDVARALLHLKEYNKNSFDAFNIGYSDSTSISQLANDIIKVSNKDIKIEYKPKRKGDIEVSRSKNKKLLSSGFKFKYTYKIGITNLSKYLLEK